LIPAGQPGLFSATAARKINLIDRIVANNAELAGFLNCRPDDIKYAPLVRHPGSAARVNINGIMNGDNAASVIRSIQSILEPEQNTLAGQVPATDIDFIVFCIDSPGGDIEFSLSIASYIVHNIDSAKVRTVAYIPYQARSDAALIAAACDEIVLGNNAVLGGDGAAVFSKKRIADARRIVQDSLMKDTFRNWSLPVSFFDPALEVNQYIREGKYKLTDYFCEEELEQQTDKQQWKKDKTVKPAGKILEITGGKDTLGFTDKTVNDFNEFKQAYRLQDEPRLAEPGWADKFLWTLRSPGMSSIILMIIIFAVIFELNTPGMGVGTFIAVMGIVIFFWIHFLDGTATQLELLLFLAGAVCVLVEIFLLPGFGIFGFGGALAMICAFILASQTFIIPQNSYQYAQTKHSLAVLVICGAGSLFIGTAVSRRINKFTKPKDTELIYETEKLADYAYLLGKSGKTLTPLVPAGKAVFDTVSGDVPVDVVSDGNIIEKDKTVEVIEVSGYRVVVRLKE
jgi:membrane-bound ClpP family serine protease